MTLRPKKQQLLNLLPKGLVQTRGPAKDNALYLTFDDGPHPSCTPRLLDLLAMHGIRASFFLVGHRAERHPSLVERIVAEGHMIGNHSYSHWSFRPMSLQQQVDEFQRADDVLQAFDQRRHHRVRPPQGHLAPALLLYCASHRRSIVYWSYDSLDYQQGPSSELVARLRAQPPRAGDILLMHDDSHKATEALTLLLPEWLAKGHTFHPLPADGA
ncbi:polysaccharide deacetylase family protein [Dyella silvae]|uniref:polysaccharide deacetylase family protein n=1 Tax=Dyella silvae TaxID=2994424 RepID=UPI0022640884|nr:polysaccharide deacetylase family protein [Dyella silvae]